MAEDWMKGAVKNPGSFRNWCASKGLLEDGKVGPKCIRAGLKSGDPRIRKRASLAKTFSRERK